MSEGFNSAAAFFFGIGGGVIWLLFGYPIGCKEDTLGQERIPAVERALGNECDEKNVLGTSPLVESEAGAGVMAIVLGLVCAGVAGVLASSSSSSSGS